MNKLALFAASAIVGGASLSASAAVLLQDNFESYPAQAAPNAAFDAAWPIVTAATAPAGGTAIESFITTGTGTNTTQVASFPANGAGNIGRRQQTFANTVPTAGTNLVWSFDFFDAAPTASYRQYSELYANDSTGALAQIIAIGENNSATAGIPTAGGTAGTYATTKYQARVALGPAGGGAGWFNLQTTRTAGWHNFKVVLNGTAVEFYVDGVLDTAFTNAAAASGASAGYDALRFSSGLSSANGGALFDNFLVETVVVPEPASLAALAGLSVFGLARRRKA